MKQHPCPLSWQGPHVQKLPPLGTAGLALEAVHVFYKQLLRFELQLHSAEWAGRHLSACKEHR